MYPFGLASLSGARRGYMPPRFKKQNFSLLQIVTLVNKRAQIFH